MARVATNSTRMNFYIPKKLITIMKRFAKRRGINASEVVRTALREYLVRELENEKKETN